MLPKFSSPAWLRQESLDDAEKRDRYENARKAVRQPLEEEYKGKFGASQPSALLSEPSDTSVSQRRRARLSQHQTIRIGEPVFIDSYQSYVDADPEKQLQADDPLDYWNSRSLSQPDLARFVFDMLVIPATSVECERVFSSTKLLIVDCRVRLLPDIISA
jgi:hAT family C-terminal dimerisation region